MAIELQIVCIPTLIKIIQMMEMFGLDLKKRINWGG